MGSHHDRGELRGLVAGQFPRKGGEKMILHISGKVRELETGRPVAGVTVEAYDADAFRDDLLGSSQTDEDGHYDVPTKARVGFFRERPDAYIMLKDGNGRTLKSTRGSHMRDIDEDVVIDVPISCYKLVEAGLLRSDQLPPELGQQSAGKTLSSFSFKAPKGDPVFADIQRDLLPKASLLELLADTMRSLRQSPDNLAPAFVKMAKLFSLGLTPKEVPGHYYGVALGLRLSPQKRALAHLDNVVGLLWGATLEEESPWVGKSFERLDGARFQGLTGQAPDPERPAFLGINHFNRLDWHPANMLTYHALSYWLNLHDAPEAERAAYANDRNGGHFVALQAPSVCSETPRDVFSLNYRWPSMHNRAPLSWLVDELVQIGDGLYLGQLLFATRRLLSGYDPKRPAADYAYDHMGYFALWDDRWNAEARRLFAFLEIPVTAPGLVSGVSLGTGPTFTTLKCETPAPAICDNAVFAQVEADLHKQESVLHLFKSYSDELQDRLDNKSPNFLRLQELFNRGAPVREMNGFYRGALVSWHGAGLFDLFKTNLLDKAWGYSARYSTWTGKRFDPADPSADFYRDPIDHRNLVKRRPSPRTPCRLDRGIREGIRANDVWIEHAVPAHPSREGAGQGHGAGADLGRACHARGSRAVRLRPQELLLHRARGCLAQSEQPRQAHLPVQLPLAQTAHHRP